MSADTERSATAALRTLLVSDLVGSTRLVEEQGDSGAADIFRRHDALARALLETHEGLEIDKTDGFLLLFKRPISAVAYALAYHRALVEISEEVGVELSARVGIHVGEVILRANPPDEVARGAKPLEVEGIAKPMAARLMSLARGRQTLLTTGAFEMARRATVGGEQAEAELEWRSHGEYLFKGVVDPVSVHEVGETGVAPLAAPPESEKVKRHESAARASLWQTARRRPLATAAVVATLLALVAGIGVTFRGLGGPSAPVGPASLEDLVETATPRLAVAVLPPRSLSGSEEDSWLGTAVAEMLTTSLGADGGLRTMDGGDVARVLRGLALEAGQELTQEQYGRIQSQLGADYLVVGSLTSLGTAEAPLLRVDLRLRDASSGETVEEAGASGTPRQLFDLLDRAGASFRRRLGVGELTQTQKLAVMASLPSDPKAARPYVEGLAGLREYDAQTARARLTEAIAAEPDHPLPHAAQARALRYLGFDAEALTEAGRAMELSEFLPPTQRSVIEATYHEAAGDFESAVEIYTVLFRSHPDDLNLGLRLALAQSQGGLGREAVATVEALRAMPPPAADDPRLDFAEAHSRYALGEFDKSRAAAERAAAKASAGGDLHLVAEAGLAKAAALQELGDPGAAESAVAEARDLFESAGDRRGVALAQELLAYSVWDGGDLDGASDLFARSRAVYRELGDTNSEGAVLQAMGSIRVDQGDMAAAEELHRESIEMARAAGDRQSEAELLNEFGVTLHMTGDLQGAQTKYSESLQLMSEVGREDLKAIALSNLAEVRFLLGHLEEAETLMKDALAINRAVGARSMAAYNGYYLGLMLAAKGDLFVARQRLKEALAAQEEIGEANEAALTRIRLAEVRLAEGDAPGAGTLAGEAEQVLRAAGAEDRAALAQTVLARALLAQGQVAEARRVAARFEERAGVSEDREVELATRIVSLRLRAADGDAAALAEAIAALSEIAEEAAADGYLAYSFEARLAAADALGKAGEASRATTAFEALERESRELGYGLYADRAERARLPAQASGSS